MHFRNVALKLFLYCWIYNGFSQITITNSSMPNVGDTIRYSIAALSSVGNYTATGANYVWHFDTLRVIGQGRRDFTNNTPYPMFNQPGKFGEKIADTLINQTIPGFGALTITDFYQFYRNTPTVFDVEGAGLKINSIPLPAFYIDKDELYNFPLTYGKYDSTTFYFSTPITTAIPFVYIKGGYRITTVDGWGTITTPYGTFNCLRLITTQYSKDTIIFNSTFGSIPIGFNNYQRSYQWLTNTEKIPVLEISGTVNGTGNFTPNLVRFRDNYRVVGIQEYENNKRMLTVFPNPSNGLFKIENVFNSDVKIVLFSIYGQNVLNIHEDPSFNDYIEIDASHLPAGKYFGNIISEGKSFWFEVQIFNR
ncbi:MAG: hypothetical protein KatS3mg027_1273 [Bacteroidia bacterium]|nr:MAG: hypothetical protein KatS3mg027_1273 [Bacteroidia bacterium]